MRIERGQRYIRDGIDLVGRIEETNGIRVARLYRAIDLTKDDAETLLEALRGNVTVDETTQQEAEDVARSVLGIPRR